MTHWGQMSQQRSLSRKGEQVPRPEGGCPPASRCPGHLEVTACQDTQGSAKKDTCTVHAPCGVAPHKPTGDTHHTGVLRGRGMKLPGATVVSSKAGAEPRQIHSSPRAPCWPLEEAPPAGPWTPKTVRDRRAWPSCAPTMGSHRPRGTSQACCVGDRAGAAVGITEKRSVAPTSREKTRDSVDSVRGKGAPRC